MYIELGSYAVYMVLVLHSAPPNVLYRTNIREHTLTAVEERWGVRNVPAQRYPTSAASQLHFHEAHL
jgi:hypothetical protein